ncbi:MAG: hypothetical protein OXI43_00755 [Candidatus Poribacteria bacterium]|nr:hypothetical protein [Candidatus Poribacteria bacterium]
MRWRQVLKNLVRTAGVLGQELISAYRELIKSIRSIDKDRMPDPRQVIRELKRILRSIIQAGKEKLGELWEAIQNLKDAIAKITKAKMPDMRDVFGSIGEWWWDLKSSLQKLKESIPSIEEVRDLIEEVRKQSKDGIPLDKVAEIIAGLGVPGLILLVVMAASPFFGAAAITASLAAIGPFGMLGGIAALLVLAFIASNLTKFGFEEVFRAVLNDLRKKGHTIQEILDKIDSYPISKELKLKLKEYIEKYSEENEEENDLEDNEEEVSSEQ